MLRKSILTTLLRIDRSSKKLWAANIQCMTPPLERDGPWKTRQLFRMIIRSWTTCWVNWGTDGTLFVASQSKGKDASPHICCCNWTQLTTSCTIQCFCRILYLLLCPPPDKTSSRRPCCSPANLQTLSRLSLTGCTEWSLSWKRTSLYMGT